MKCLFAVPLLFCALDVSAEKKPIFVVWQSPKDSLWETEWIEELLCDFQLIEIFDGKHSVMLDKSIIVTGPYEGDYFSKLKAANMRFGVIHTSDDMYSHCVGYYDECPFIFRNYWNKRFQKNVHSFPLGYKQGLRQNDLSIPSRGIAHRDLIWSFAGRIWSHPTRNEMISQMKKIPHHHVHEIFVWNDSSSLKAPAYTDLLLRSIFVPCPRSYWNLDSFRVCEALECGCIPIVEKKPIDYFASLFGEYPFPAVNSWDEAPALVSALLEDSSRLEQLRQKCHRWWLNTKKKFQDAFRSEIERTFWKEEALVVIPAKELESKITEATQYVAIKDMDDMIFSGKSEKWNEITRFLQHHPEWQLCDRSFSDASGQVVLERGSHSEEKLSREARIDELLNNRIILCTGPSYHKRDLLQLSTEWDQKLIPFKKVFVSTNDPAIMDIEFPQCKTETFLIKNREASIDCLNCILTTIRSAANDPECLDDDIILFKHETVFINDMYLVRKAIGKFLDGYELVARDWVTDQHLYMTDVFFVKVGAIRSIFKNIEEVQAYPEDCSCCEAYITKLIASLKAYSIEYRHATRKETELGFFHMPKLGEEYRDGYWDKKNYMQLFKHIEKD